jgi:Coenzyme PQQ synthesis protein D (PqqD)
MKPRARRSDLVVRELEGELLVYDLASHRAHRLNPTAALVFQGCDGRTALPDLAARLRRELGVPADERWVRLALRRLSRAGLLEKGVSAPAGVSRREILQRSGRAAGLALLLPAVTSILAPTPAEAAASCVQGNPGCAGQAFGTPCYQSSTTDCGIVCICSGGNCVQAANGLPCP